MYFKDIIGQEEVKNQYIRSVKEQRIPHAQLICGNEGSGKRSLALAYARYIFCENKGESDACGVCPACLKFNKYAHPDLHFVFPVIKKPGKDKAVSNDFINEFREILIENPFFSEREWFSKIAEPGKRGMIYTHESDEIIRKINLKTYEAEYKIMIIWLPEKMHLSCSNKLLKLLEEPPAKTIFLLVTKEPDNIISTILSRTQRINIPPLETEAIANALFSRYNLPIADAQHFARTANGNYIKAFESAQKNEINKEQLERFAHLMRTAYKIINSKEINTKGQSLKDLKKFSEEMAKIGRENQRNFLKYAQNMIRENFIYNFHQQDLNYLSASENDFANKFAPFINENNVFKMMEELALAERHIEQNVQAKIVFYDLALKIIVLFKK